MSAAERLPDLAQLLRDLAELLGDFNALLLERGIGEAQAWELTKLLEERLIGHALEQAEVEVTTMEEAARNLRTYLRVERDGG